MAVKLLSSSGGSVTLDVPVTASNFALTVPTANGTMITTGSTGQVIPKAALPTGSVLQVVSQQAGGVTYTSISENLTMLTQSFTPTSASSKVLAIMNIVTERTGGGSSGNYVFVGLRRNGTTVASNWGNALGYQLTTGARGVGAHTFLDSPATTSPISYTLSGNFSSSGNVQWDVYTLQLTLMEIAA